MGKDFREALSKAGASVRHDVRPGDIGDIISMHGQLYTRGHGYSLDFEAYVAKTFSAYPWPLGTRERLWIVEKNGELSGSIAIVRASETEAQLRWLLLSPELRGCGLGACLVEEAIGFCRSSAYRAVLLWTEASLTTATRLYRQAGFTLTQTRTGMIWGAQRTEERYDLSLD